MPMSMILRSNRGDSRESNDEIAVRRACIVVSFFFLQILFTEISLLSDAISSPSNLDCWKAETFNEDHYLLIRSGESKFRVALKKREKDTLRNVMM